VVDIPQEIALVFTANASPNGQRPRDNFPHAQTPARLGPASDPV